MNTERRQSPRYPCQLRASIMIDGQLFESVCLDIGPGGAYLATSVMPAPGTRMSVALASAAGTSMIAVPAEVLYLVRRSTTRQPGCAVRWLETPVGLQRTLAVIESGLARRERPSNASQAVTTPQPVAQLAQSAAPGAKPPAERVPSAAAIDRTARYTATRVVADSLPDARMPGGAPVDSASPITQRAKKKV